MIPFIDRLNLRPMERRFVVGAVLLLFVVANFVWVFPHFKDWKRLQNEMMEARRTLARYQAEADKLQAYRATLTRLEGETPVVLPAEQAVQLLRTVQLQADQKGVQYTQIRPVQTYTGTKTNAFFEEQSVIMNVTTGEKELVDFLVSLGTGNSMIRVRDLDLKPDGTQTKLVGSVTLVATYQKKAPPKPSAPAPTPVAAKPASTTTKPTPATLAKTNVPPLARTSAPALAKTNAVLTGRTNVPPPPRPPPAFLPKSAERPTRPPARITTETVDEP